MPGSRRSMRNVVRAQYFMTDMREFAGVTAAWSDRYGKQPHPFASGPSARSAAAFGCRGDRRLLDLRGVAKIIRFFVKMT